MEISPLEKVLYWGATGFCAATTASHYSPNKLCSQIKSTGYPLAKGAKYSKLSLDNPALANPDAMSSR